MTVAGLVANYHGRQADEAIQRTASLFHQQDGPVRRASGLHYRRELQKADMSSYISRSELVPTPSE